MLISIRHQFVFVHIPKTAGTALSFALARHARFRDRALSQARAIAPVRRAITTMLGGDRFIERATGFPTHARLADAEARLGAPFIERLNVVAFARNPFSRAYSLYQHARSRPEHRRHRMFSAMSFKEAAEIMRREEWPTQSDYLRRGDGDVQCDFIGRFEHFDDDAKALFDFLALPGVKVNIVNVGERRAENAREEISAGGAAIVEQYGEDFDRFGYSTDPAADFAPLVASGRAAAST